MNLKYDLNALNLSPEAYLVFIEDVSGEGAPTSIGQVTEVVVSLTQEIVITFDPKPGMSFTELYGACWAELVKAAADAEWWAAQGE